MLILSSILGDIQETKSLCRRFGEKPRFHQDSRAERRSTWSAKQPSWRAFPGRQHRKSRSPLDKLARSGYTPHQYH
ncbi:MAG: hypothetical protein WCQ45_05960, partial [bacterium]